METVAQPPGLEEAVAPKPSITIREPGPHDLVLYGGKSIMHGTFQVEILRTDHRSRKRIDIPFKVADLYDAARRDAVRAMVHESLDVLLDSLGLPE